MIRLLLCDLDGTLVEPWRTIPLPDVRERLRVLQDQGGAGGRGHQPGGRRLPLGL